MIRELLATEGVWQGILLFLMGMGMQFILIIIFATIMKLRRYSRYKNNRIKNNKEISKRLKKKGLSPEVITEEDIERLR